MRNGYPPIFQERKGSEFKVVGINAKRARGLMAKYIVKNKILKADKLKHFSSAGYKFNECFLAKILCLSEELRIAGSILSVTSNFSLTEAFTFSANIKISSEDELS